MKINDLHKYLNDLAKLWRVNHNTVANDEDYDNNTNLFAIRRYKTIKNLVKKNLKKKL